MAGHFSLPGSAECTKCPVNTYADKSGSAVVGAGGAGVGRGVGCGASPCERGDAR